MKKAISPVITLVLLLILALSAIAGAFYWMSYMQAGMQEQSGREIERTSSEKIDYSLIAHYCDSTTDTFTMTLINNGPNYIPGDALFVLTVNDINGVGIGTNTSMAKSTYNNIPANAVFILEATIEGLDIELYDEYSLKLTSDTSVTNFICNAQ